MRLEKPNTSNYFAFYGLSIAFNLDDALLKQAYLSKSKLYHPDFYSDQLEDQAIAIAASSFNNNAFKTLSNPVLRAQYLVDLQAGINEQTVQLPNDFLIEMMDLNEQLDELIDNVPETLKLDIEAHKAQIFEHVKSFASQADWVNTQMALLKWRYLERLEQRLR